MNKALIIIDAQKFFLNPKTKAVVDKIAAYLDKNSGQYQAIYFTIFRNDPKAPLWQITKWHGCSKLPATDICDELKRFTSKQNLFYKNILSAVKVPAIKKDILVKQIQQVDLCGFDTDCCVLATAYDLFDQNIKPVILENLTWSTSKEKLHGPAIKMAQRNVGFIKKV
jgi:nicotinamidase-related amidase